MSVRLRTSGQGADLALLHGWGMNSAVWDALAAELARDFRVHAVDWQAGDGATPATLVDALAAALPPALTVCGWSLGGQLALAWAQARPRQVERLVLLATTPRFVCGGDWQAGMPADVFASFARSVAADAAGALQRFFALQAEGDGAARAVLRELRAVAGRGAPPPAASLHAGLRWLADSDLRPALAGIAQPALVVHGARDGVIPPAAGAYLAGALPHAQLVALEDAAHALFSGRSAWLARQIRDFHERH